jgi:integrase
MLMRVRGIKRVTVKRGGKTYVYYRHRKTGKRLEHAPGTPEFLAEIAALETAQKAKAPKAGTWGALVLLYRAAPEHTGLAARTRKDYERVFLYLEPLNDAPLLEWDTPSIYDMRDKAFRKHGRRFSKYVLQVISLVLEWGRERKHLKVNPAWGLKAIRRPRGLPRANRPWTDEERETVLREAPPALLLMIGLGMFAGLREGDASRLPWGHYEKSVIASIARKTGEPLWIPAHFRLRQILDRTPKVATIIATNSRGKPWTESGFRASFFKFLKRLEKAGKIGPGLTYHGLRHTVGTLIIEAGGETRDVAAILGHQSDASSEHYSNRADRRKRATATIRRWERNERKKMDKRTD